MASKSVKSDIGIRLVTVDNAQSASQVIAERVQITFRLLDLGELLGAASLCDEIDRELIRGSAADEVGKVGELKGWSRFLG